MAGAMPEVLIIGAGVFGQSTLAEFALALLIGMAVGAYSSIFIAVPLLGLQVLTLYLTYGRTGWLGCMAAIVVLVGLAALLLLRLEADLAQRLGSQQVIGIVDASTWLWPSWC